MPQDPSYTELNPIRAMRPHLRAKGYVVPAGLAVCGLFAMMETSGGLFWFLAACFLVAGEMGLIYAFCGKRKPWWCLVGTMVATALSLVFLSGFVSTGNKLLTFNYGGFIFPVGPGLVEELFKSAPVFLLLIISREAGADTTFSWGVYEPLDGILIGAASGFGFAMVETFAQYANSSEQIFVRFLSNLVGHAAFSGYFGYFIGLAALRKEHRLRTIMTGFSFSFLLHGAWDFFLLNKMGVAFIPVGVLSYAGLAAAILKARQISPFRIRNFATMMVPNAAVRGGATQRSFIPQQPEFPPSLVIKPLTEIASGRRILLNQREIKIGRDPGECQVVVAASAEGISRVHCSVRSTLDGRGALLRDCDSTNGTFLGNGIRVSSERESAIPEGGTFYLGSKSVMFQIRREVG